MALLVYGKFMGDPASRPTLQSIAAAAGVSRMTASLALRNHPRISVATREKIHRLARELNYRPDPEVSRLMAHLRRQRPPQYRPTIALITNAQRPGPWRLNRHFARFYEGARQRAAELGYQLEEFWLREPGLARARLTKILQTRSIEGLLIGPLYRPSGRLALDFDQFAVAEHGQDIWVPRIHRANHDHFQGMMLAMRQLLRLGYQKIGAIFLENYHRHDVHTWEGAYHYHQQKLKPADRLAPFLSEMQDRKGVVAWVRKHRPEAVVSSHLEVKFWLTEAEIAIPRDVSFVYLDWLDDSNACAGINQHYEIVAAAAVDLVVGQLQRHERGLPPFSKLVLIEGEWVAGPTVRDRRTARSGR